MILLIFSLYGIHAPNIYYKDPIRLYNILGEEKGDSVRYKGMYKGFLGNDLFYLGEGKFTFKSCNDSIEYIYLYSIPNKKLKVLFKFELLKEREQYPEYVVIKRDKEDLIVRIGNCVYINDTLILISASKLYGWNYILYINPEKDSILDIVDGPPSNMTLRFSTYNKQQGLLTFYTDVPECTDFELSRNYLYSIDTKKYNKINEGYIYLKMWVNDYQLLISDATERYERLVKRERGEPIPEQTWDYYIYNIKTEEKKIVKDDAKGMQAYFYKGELYDLDLGIIGKDSARIRLRDGKGNIIREKIVPKSRYYYGPNYFIPYPEDTNSSP